MMGWVKRKERKGIKRWEGKGRTQNGKWRGDRKAKSREGFRTLDFQLW
jgi:hypothetical protein